ncbi:uncharacterized protein K489DRAFT_366094 [Dissoconium aciculare CBS 342.82]|uniref:C2H2-type domain-containing protein n=1 Tax=Dissoconium aciculare CBS 342.82 TaxID=1314786 RepID=A0A6J3MFX1_9PEZI|nr:uncharacterized protein K489DRAFT_366094 [Dissoconium aciculare CBS 342.82]KAF1826865.1 hypothetical protein K489DRAFT_366094 [Dissoconium aciculare CBS 342.82]
MSDDSARDHTFDGNIPFSYPAGNDYDISNNYDLGGPYWHGLPTVQPTTYPAAHSNTTTVAANVTNSTIQAFVPTWVNSWSLDAAEQLHNELKRHVRRSAFGNPTGQKNGHGGRRSQPATARSSGQTDLAFPFRCRRCRQGFKQKSTCTRHENTHDAPKWFCRYCKMGFNRSDPCKRHEAVHETPGWPCPVKCREPFNRRDLLIDHCKKHLGRRTTVLVEQYTWDAFRSHIYHLYSPETADDLAQVLQSWTSRF